MLSLWVFDNARALKIVAQRRQGFEASSRDSVKGLASAIDLTAFSINKSAFR